MSRFSATPISTLVQKVLCKYTNGSDLTTIVEDLKSDFGVETSRAELETILNIELVSCGLVKRVEGNDLWALTDLKACDMRPVLSPRSYLLQIIFFLIVIAPVVTGEVTVTFCSLLDVDRNLGFATCGSDYGAQIQLPVYKSHNKVFYSAQTRTVDLLRDGNTTFECTQKNKRSLYCEQNCLFKFSQSVCGGDFKYCRAHNCSTGKKICTCSAKQLVSQLQFMVGNDKWKFAEEINIITLHRDLTVVERTLAKSTRSLSSLKQNKRGDVRPDCQVDIFMRLENRLLKVTINEEIQLTLVLTKGDWQNLVVVNDQITDYTVPADIFTSNGILTSSVYCENQLIKVQQFEIIAETVCSFKDCLLCWDNINSFKCMPGSQRWALICTWSLLLILAFLFIPLFIMVLKWAIILLCFPVKCCYSTSRRLRDSQFSQDLSNKGVVKLVGIKQYFFAPQSAVKKNDDMMNGIIVVGEEDNEEIRRQRLRNEAMRMQSASFSRIANTSIVLILLLPLVLAEFENTVCSSSILGTATFEDCVDKGSGLEECKAAFSNSVVISGPGRKACLLFQINASTIFELEIVFVVQTDVVSLSKEYYTSDWTGFYQSAKKCREAAPPLCTDCQCVQSKCEDCCPDRTAYGKLDDSRVLDYPGKSRCRRVCGCATCDCFLCEEACLFSGFGIIPGENIWKVSAVDQRQLTPLIYYRLSDGSDDILDGFISIVGLETQVLDLLITVQGNLQGSITEFGDNRVVSKNTQAKFGQVSIVNQPAKQVIGDIQADFEADLVQADVDSFIFASDLYSISEGGDRDTYSFSANGLKQLDQVFFKSFPITINGDLWIFQDGFLKSNVSNPGALVLTIESESNFRIVRKRDVVCPQLIGEVSASGCFNCDEGSVARFNLKSTCKSGFVSFTTSEPTIQLLTLTSKIETSETQVNVSFKTSSKANDFSLTVSANGGSLTLSVVFQANEASTVRNNSESKGDGIISLTDFFNDVGSFFTDTIPKFFESIFNGTADWWEYIIFALIVIGVIVALIFLAPYILSLLTWLKVRVQMIQKVRFGKSTKKLN